MSWKERIHQWQALEGEITQGSHANTEDEDNAVLQKLRERVTVLVPDELFDAINRIYWQGAGKIIPVGAVSKGTYSNPQVDRRQSMYFNDTYAGFALVKTSEDTTNQHDFPDDESSQPLLYDGIAIGYTKNGKYFVTETRKEVLNPAFGYIFHLGRGREITPRGDQALQDAVREQLLSAAEAFRESL
jgi:hypothetical protein